MKLWSFFPPLVVTIGGAIWLGTQTVTISRIEKENHDLDLRISNQRARPANSSIDRPTTQPGRPQMAPKDTATSNLEPIDWKSLVGDLREMQQSGGMADMKAMIRLQQRLHSMSADDLAAALDEIAALGLSEQDQLLLEQTLVGPLIQKDPEMALTRFVDRLSEQKGVWSWQLSDALKAWAKDDPAAATHWFDSQIEAGKFESKSLNGRNEVRIQFEGSLISHLVHSDVEAASLRLGNLPEDQRANVLRHPQFSQIKEEDQLSYARLTREQVPEKERAEVLGQPANQIALQKGYDEVTAYIDRIQAADEERASIVEKAAQGRLSHLNRSNPVTAEQIDEMRAWASTQAPGSQDSATGKALANLAGFNDKDQFARVAKLAEQYHESSSNDDVLANFLGGWAAGSNKEVSRELAAKVRDEKRRTELLKRFE